MEQTPYFCNSQLGGLNQSGSASLEFNLGDKKYSYPWGPEMHQTHDILSAREMAKINPFGWALAVKQSLDPNKYLDRSMKYGVFVDPDYGLIRLTVKAPTTDHIRLGGGIFNPKKGEATIATLTKMVDYLARNTQKEIHYETQRVNHTVQLVRLLHSAGFTPFTIEYPFQSVLEYRYVGNPEKAQAENHLQIPDLDRFIEQYL